MPNAVVVAGIGVKGISVAAAVGFAAVTAVAEATLGVVVDCVTLAAGLAVCGFLVVAVAAAVGVLAAFVVAVLVVVVFLVTALVAGAVLAVVSETVLVAANA